MTQRSSSYIDFPKYSFVLSFFFNLLILSRISFFFGVCLYHANIFSQWIFLQFTANSGNFYSDFTTAKIDVAYFIKKFVGWYEPKIVKTLWSLN